MSGSLNRNLSLKSALAIAISMIVGSGVFALPGLAVDASDPITALIAWFFVALCVAPLIQIFSKLGQILPNVDGVAGFASHGIGAWSLGGFNLIACGALAVGMPAFFFVVASYICDLFALDHQLWRLPLAILVVWLTTLLNLSGLQNISFINRAIVVVVILVMLIIIAMSLFTLNFDQVLSNPILKGYTLDVESLWASSVIIFWAFQGWENLTFGLAEVEDAQQNIPKIFWLSFVFIVALYLAFAWAVSMSVLAGYEISGVSGLSIFLGDGSIKMVLLILIVAILIANANSWVFGASRAYYAAARNGMLPAVIARTNSQNIPNWSLCLSAIFYSILIMAIEFMSISVSTAFIITTQGFIILYGFSIFSYIREFKKHLSAWAVGVFALAGWFFLIHNFDVLLIYPMILFCFGAIMTKLRKTHHSSRELV